MTVPEVILWQAIRRDALGCRVRRQYPFGDYYLDFYIPKLAIAIEVDGNIHLGQFERDEERDQWLKSQGIMVIRIHARSIYSNVNDVTDFLKAKIEERSSNLRTSSIDSRII